LSICQQFKPLHQHILSISQALPELSNQTQAIQKVVDYLIKNKLLITEQDWKEKLSVGSTVPAIVDAGIVIRVYDNPKLLNRLLQSLVEYQNKFNTKYSVQIYTASSNEKIENEIELIVKSFKKDLNINIHGSTWQNQFVKMLKKEFKDKGHIIDWLLTASNNQNNNQDDQYNGGRLWNFALLNNAGKKFLFFDDDTIFESRTLGDESKVIELNDHADLDVGFALSLTEIRNSSSEYNEDVLQKMINSCGQTVGNWLSTIDIETGSIENLNLVELERLNAHSVIKTIGNGTWGSPRTNSNYWLYYLEGKQKEEFWKTRETYLDNIEASNLLHYTQNYRFMSLGNFAPSAIDNSSMTPFANPGNQKEDYFYNAVTLFCYPNQVMLHCPFMMGHLQEKSGIKSNQNHIAITPNFNKFMADYALTLIQSTDAIDPKLRLRTLANYVLGLADSGDTNIHNRLKEYLSQVRSDMVLNMQHQMAKSPDAPVYWQADVRELIEANGKELLQNNPPILEGWKKGLSKQDCVGKAKQELMDTARALELWPDLWEFCQTNK
ncbi:MAG: hypothetical protein L3J83_02930, partial [Proteobacteria bacterium]|nr:hypothetical protein [Pseudomonadota bacterium]